MNLTAVIIAIVALICFLVEFARTKPYSIFALGMVFFVLAFVLTYVIQSGPIWVIH